MTQTDAQLIRAARSDPGAFAELYRRHVRSIHAYLRAHSPPHAASELTAETFAQAALSLRRFRDQADGSARPWLYGIARNLARRHLENQRIETRSRQRLGMPIRSYELDTDASNDRLDAEQLTPALTAALDTLPPSQRQAVELRIVHELPFKQIARTLGCSEVAARIRVTRALGTLSRVLKEAR